MHPFSFATPGRGRLGWLQQRDASVVLHDRVTELGAVLTHGHPDAGDVVDLHERRQATRGALIVAAHAIAGLPLYETNGNLN